MTETARVKSSIDNAVLNYTVATATGKVVETTT